MKMFHHCMFTAFAISSYQKKIQYILLHYCLSHSSRYKILQYFFYHNNTCILILLKFRPPQKENTMVEEEAAEMEDKVSEAEEESADQKAKSKPKEV